MSVYKPAKSPYYHYDFQIHGRRFQRSTEVKTKKAAEAVERQVKAQAREDMELEKRTGNGPLTMDFAAGRYWLEVGQTHVCRDDTERALARLVEFLGKDTRLDQITDAHVAALVAWRRGHTIKGKAKDAAGNPMRLISPATVNRTTTVLLKAIFSRARRTWKLPLPLEPNWRDHWLTEPPERVRELHDHEADALHAAIRDDYAPWIAFTHMTGLRRSETLLRWTAVNFATGQIRTLGKRSQWVTTPITDSVRAILEPLRGHHPEFVFTFVATNTRNGRVKGQRYPITYEGSKSQFVRDRSKSKVLDFKFHDFRHDAATKALRAGGNLKLVQKMLGHTSITTTSRYAHVLDSDLAEVLERVSKSRNKSRTDDAKVA